MRFSPEAVLNVVSHLPAGEQESLDIPGAHVKRERSRWKFSVEAVNSGDEFCLLPVEVQGWESGIRHLKLIFRRSWSAAAAARGIAGPAGARPAAHVLARTAPRAFPAEVLEPRVSARNRDDLNIWQQLG